MRKTDLTFLLALILLCVIASCSSQPVQDTPTAVTPSITPTPTLSATATLVPSDTPTVNYSTSLALTKAHKTAVATFTPATATFTPSKTRKPSLTFTPGPTKTFTPTYDTTLLDEALSAYPLKVGDERVYEVSITYSVEYTENGFVYENWHGFVHEQVIEQYEIKGGIGFVLYYPDFPFATDFPDRKGVIGEFTKKIEFRDNVVYDEYGREILEFPLADGKEWLAFGDDHPEYNWVVKTQDDIETPAGRFSDCYELSLITGPDSTEIYFCNGVGIVKEAAWHHPPTWIYEWELYQMPDTME